MEKTTLLIVEDHESTSFGLQKYLETQDDILVLGVKTSIKDALQVSGREQPDCILLDINLPDGDGLQSIPQIRALSSESRIIIYTARDDISTILDSYRMGADGCVSKATFGKSLVLAFHAVMSGSFYLDSRFTQRILQHLDEEDEEAGIKDLAIEVDLEELSRRERELFDALGQGYSIEEIAERLCISVKTASNHRTNIIRKLGLKNSKALFKFAYQTIQNG